MFKEISCSTCVAACCKAGMVLPLKNREAETLEEGGAIIDAYPQKQRLLGRALVRVGLMSVTGDYLLESDCGYLGEIDGYDGQLGCEIRDDPARPKICEAFKAGSYVCRELRVKAGVDTWEDFEEWREATSQQ